MRQRDKNRVESTGPEIPKTSCINVNQNVPVNTALALSAVFGCLWLHMDAIMFVPLSFISAWPQWFRLQAYGWCNHTQRHAYAHMPHTWETEYEKTSVFTMFTLDSTVNPSCKTGIKGTDSNEVKKCREKLLALPCCDCEPFLKDWKWKCFVGVYANGVLCQDVWLFRRLRDCDCEDYKSACLRSVLLLESPAMTKHHKMN